MKQEIQDKFDKLPFEKQSAVEEFIELLFNKYVDEQDDLISVAELRKKNMDWAKGKIWMADDFIEAPIN
jgi:hypothetical protein